MDRFRKELRMMVMDPAQGLQYSEHCIACGCSFQMIPILTRKHYIKVLNFPKGAGGQVQEGAQDDGHESR